MTTTVTQIQAASSDMALKHFENRLTFETDCWDVHYAFSQQEPDFVLVDVRSPDMYSDEHIPGAINIPHGKMTARRMDEYPAETLFVVYCAGPHCNGANKAAMRLAGLGRPVKEMIGGIEGRAQIETIQMHIIGRFPG